MKTGTTILLTTQYLEEADQLADQIVVIDDGIVIAHGTANELKSKIGKDRLELVFKNAKTLELASKCLKGDVVEKNHAEHSLTLAIINTNKDVKRALDSLVKAGINFESMAVHKPTLDDVFLSVTGKSKKSESEEEK